MLWATSLPAAEISQDCVTFWTHLNYWFSEGTKLLWCDRPLQIHLGSI